MRISGNTSLVANASAKLHVASTSENRDQSLQGSRVLEDASKTPIENVLKIQEFDNIEEAKAKVKEAVDTMNEMLEVNNNKSKFLFHEGLDRYYVTVVDRESEEVVKEIPPKKLLDAFYEMQKMLGMIVDEKI